MTETLLLVLKIAVVTLILAIGLGSSPADLSYLWRRPRHLGRSLALPGGDVACPRLGVPTNGQRHSVKGPEIARVVACGRARQ